jgi:hypothetical protein
MKTADQIILKLLGGILFLVKAPVTLDLWPSDLKNNKGPLMVMINLSAKYEDCGSKVS